jgi:DNA-binding transcriptional MerR regulator
MNALSITERGNKMEERAITLGVMSSRLNIPIHRVEYLVRARDIKPVSRAGRFRVFDEQAIETLRQEVSQMEQRKLR